MTIDKLRPCTRTTECLKRPPVTVMDHMRDELIYYCGGCTDELRPFTQDELDMKDNIKKQDLYFDLIKPVINDVVQLFINMEGDKPVGLDVSDPLLDSHKVLSHLSDALQLKDNPDGMSHGTAMVARAIKFELGVRKIKDELDNDNDT